MAVDVMHLSVIPGSSPGHASFSSSPSHKSTAAADASSGRGAQQHQQQQKELSRSSQELSAGGSSVANSPSRSSAEGDSLSGSELSWSCTPEEQQVVGRIRQATVQMEEDIDVSVGPS